MTTKKQTPAKKKKQTTKKAAAKKTAASNVISISRKPKQPIKQEPIVKRAAEEGRRGQQTVADMQRELLSDISSDLFKRLDMTMDKETRNAVIQSALEETFEAADELAWSVAFECGYENGWDEGFDCGHECSWFDCLEAIASGKIKAPAVSARSLKAIKASRNFDPENPEAVKNPAK